MKTFRKHLNEKLKKPEFKKGFEEEQKLVKLSISITECREKQGLSQEQLAKKAEVTQQQISKIENASNCNIKTFLKVCGALGIDLQKSFKL